MAVVLKKSTFSSSEDTGSTSTGSKKLRKAQRNVIQLCFILLIFFMMCWTYSLVINLTIILDPYVNFSGTDWNIATLLIVFNSCINPFIYTIRYDEFKNELKRLVCSH